MTSKALDHMKKTGCTAYEAAMKFGLATATVYAAAKRQRCPHCGQFTDKVIRPEPKPKDPAAGLLD